jgi:uncharacterized membrane protein YhaH (DUF805 family)
MNEYLTVWQKFAEFSGRARRQEYWMFILFHLIIVFAAAFVLSIIDSMVFGTPVLTYLLYVYAAAVLVPALAVSVRRLHDTGKSGWFVLISLVPFVGSIILLVFMLGDSQPFDNEYGPSPKAAF